MRIAVSLAILLAVSSPTFAQRDQFPLIAKVVASDTERVPAGSSTSITTAMPGTIWQHPQSNTSTHYRNEVTVTAELENRTYHLLAPQLIDPGEYQASLDGSSVRLLLKDKNGKPKTVKLHVVSVAAK